MYCHINLPANEYINSYSLYVERIPNFLIKQYFDISNVYVLDHGAKSSIIAKYQKPG